MADVPEGESLEGGGEEVLAGAVVGDVGSDRGDHAKRRSLLVAEVGLHHGGGGRCSVMAAAVVAGEARWLLWLGFGR